MTVHIYNSLCSCVVLQLPSMHQELTDGRLDDELVVPSNTRVYSIAKVREKLHKVYSCCFIFRCVLFVCLLQSH